MSHSHKEIVEKLTSTINARHVNHLDHVLEENVEKIENNKVVFKNIGEAREYYSMEHEARPSANYEIVQFDDYDQHKNTLTATINYNKHHYKTTYTFSPSGKIQTINSTIIQE